MRSASSHARHAVIAHCVHEYAVAPSPGRLSAPHALEAACSPHRLPLRPAKRPGPSPRWFGLRLSGGKLPPPGAGPPAVPSPPLLVAAGLGPGAGAPWSHPPLPASLRASGVGAAWPGAPATISSSCCAPSVPCPVCRRARLCGAPGWAAMGARSIAQAVPIGFRRVALAVVAGVPGAPVVHAPPGLGEVDGHRARPACAGSCAPPAARQPRCGGWHSSQATPGSLRRTPHGCWPGRQQPCLRTRNDARPRGTA